MCVDKAYPIVSFDLQCTITPEVTVNLLGYLSSNTVLVHCMYEKGMKKVRDAWVNHSLNVEKSMLSVLLWRQFLLQIRLEGCKSVLKGIKWSEIKPNILYRTH